MPLPSLYHLCCNDANLCSLGSIGPGNKSSTILRGHDSTDWDNGASRAKSVLWSTPITSSTWLWKRRAKGYRRIQDTICQQISLRFIFIFRNSCKNSIDLERYNIISIMLNTLQSLKPHSTPPSPIEPPIDPGLLGPHQFLEYRQRLATVIVADHRPKLGQQDRRNS